MLRTRLFLTLTIAGLWACAPGTAPADGSDDRPGPATSESAALSDTVEIPLGAERGIDRGQIVIGFLQRVSESRCPANAMCVWQGDASVRLRIRTGGISRDTVLHTALEPKAFTINGYVVTVPGLMPYPGTWPEDQPEPKAVVLVKVEKK